MGKFDGIYLFTDVDGTLASVHDEIPNKNKQAIEYFTKNGGTFSVATGRYLGDLDVLDGLNINGLCILNNGACIYDFKKQNIISTGSLPENSIEPLINFCKQHTELGLLIVNDDGYTIPIFDDVSRPIFHERYAIKNLAEIKMPFYKVLIVANEGIYQVIQMLKNKKIDGIDMVQTGLNSIEIVPKDITKGQAFLQICKKNNIAKSQTYFVGDSFNDISMMENAGFSGAVQEAHDMVKECADVVVCNFKDGAIYDMVKIIEDKLAK